MDVSDRSGNLQAAPEVFIGLGPPSLVGADHPEVMVGDGTAMIVATSLEGEERLLVMGQRLVVSALDVGENAEILFDAPPEGWVGATQLEGSIEPFPGGADRAALELEARQS